MRLRCRWLSSSPVSLRVVRRSCLLCFVACRRSSFVSVFLRMVFVLMVVVWLIFVSWLLRLRLFCVFMVWCCLSVGRFRFWVLLC